MIGASLKAYQEGPNTRAWRERIIVNYLNTVPLAAAPGYGEIHGLGEGLYAWFGMRLPNVVAALKRTRKQSGKNPRVQASPDTPHLGARAVRVAR